MFIRLGLFSIKNQAHMFCLLFDSICNDRVQCLNLNIDSFVCMASFFLYLLNKLIFVCLYLFKFDFVQIFCSASFYFLRQYDLCLCVCVYVCLSGQIGILIIQYQLFVLEKLIIWNRNRAIVSSVLWNNFLCNLFAFFVLSWQETK